MNIRPLYNFLRKKFDYFLNNSSYATNMLSWYINWKYEKQNHINSVRLDFETKKLPITK